jgi:hypothetical protein
MNQGSLDARASYVAVTHNLLLFSERDRSKKSPEPAPFHPSPDATADDGSTGVFFLTVILFSCSC